MASRKRVHGTVLKVDVALTVPAVRMLVVVVGLYDDDSIEHEFLPVVAIQAFRELHFTADGDKECPPESATVDGLERAGWRFRQSLTVPDVMFINENHLDLALEHFPTMMMVSATDYQIVAAPWDPREDAERLQPVVDELAARLRTRYKPQSPKRRKGPKLKLLFPVSEPYLPEQA